MKRIKGKWLQPNPLSFKEREGVRMGLLQVFETHPHLSPPLEGEEMCDNWMQLGISVFVADD
jgi:hypothetical protein